MPGPLSRQEHRQTAAHPIRLAVVMRGQQCRKRRKRMRPWACTLCAFTLALAVDISSSARGDASVTWDFAYSQEGWGASSASEMHAEVRWDNGLLRGTVSGENPFLDSPIFALQSDPAEVVVMRMMYNGAASEGHLDIRVGSSPYPAPELSVELSESTWGRSLRAQVVGASQLEGIANATDGDPYSSWESGFLQDGSQWLDLDLERPFPVNQIVLQGSGNGTSPASFILEWSTSSSGPWNILLHAIDFEAGDVEQRWNFPLTSSRLWRLRIPSTHGSPYASIREVELRGPSAGQQLASVPFEIEGDGLFRTLYIPLGGVVSGSISQLRMRPSPPGSGVVGESFAIDWVRVMRKPRVDRVLGCIDKFFDNPYSEVVSNIAVADFLVNDALVVGSTWFGPALPQFKLASTYGCPREGGMLITLIGENLGFEGSEVLVDGVPCVQVQHLKGENLELTCILPPGSSDQAWVEVSNGLLPGLRASFPILGYLQPPSQPADPPEVSNLASHAVDVSWLPPAASFWDAMMISGYEIEVSNMDNMEPTRLVTLGNVTTTTITSLQPNVAYQLRLRALVESRVGGAWTQVDLYGRRPTMPGALAGGFSPAVNFTTLEHDIQVLNFTALSVVNASATDDRASWGPRAQWGGEGHYGLHLVGSAHIENCNATSACCDGFPNCAGMGCSAGIVASAEEVQAWAATSGLEVNAECGPALRLTGSFPGLAGALWYPRMQYVGEGFSSTFSFRLSNPSLRCAELEDVHSSCRSRGADGLAFVLQADAADVLGEVGAGLGYSGLTSALIVEFDSYFNPESLDPFENHISVLTAGRDGAVTSSHSLSLGDAVAVPDLTDGSHVVMITYSPQLEVADILAGLVSSTVQAGRLLPQWDAASAGGGHGLLKVYVDDMLVPVLAVPLNLEACLRLHHGRAYVGFTAATGIDTWQVHDLLSFTFAAHRQDSPRYAMTPDTLTLL